jgi:hypothetical protein
MQRRSRRLVAVTLTAGACVLLVLRSVFGSDHATVIDSTRTLSSTTTSTLGDRSEVAARRTAIDYLELTEKAPSLGPAAAADAQRAVSTSRAAKALASEVESVLANLLAQYPTLKIRVAPISLRSSADGDGWRVSVWYVETLTLADVVVDDWRTVSYVLRWERERWLIDARTSTRGPVPARSAALAATPPDEFEAALAGFTDGW